MTENLHENSNCNKRNNIDNNKFIEIESANDNNDDNNNDNNNSNDSINEIENDDEEKNQNENDNNNGDNENNHNDVDCAFNYPTSSNDRKWQWRKMLQKNLLKKEHCEHIKRVITNEITYKNIKLQNQIKRSSILKFGCPLHDLKPCLTKYDYKVPDHVLCNGYSQHCNDQLFRNNNAEIYKKIVKVAEYSFSDLNIRNDNQTLLKTALNIQIITYKENKLHSLITIPIHILRTNESTFEKRFRPGLYNFEANNNNHTKDKNKMGTWLNGKLFYVRINDIVLLSLIEQRLYLQVALYSAECKKKRDGLYDIIGGIGFCQLQKHRHDGIHNCIILRSNDENILNVLLKSKISIYQLCNNNNNNNKNNAINNDENCQINVFLNNQPLHLSVMEPIQSIFDLYAKNNRYNSDVHVNNGNDNNNNDNDNNDDDDNNNNDDTNYKSDNNHNNDNTNNSNGNNTINNNNNDNNTINNNDNNNNTEAYSLLNTQKDLDNNISNNHNNMSTQQNNMKMSSAFQFPIVASTTSSMQNQIVHQQSQQFSSFSTTMPASIFVQTPLPALSTPCSFFFDHNNEIFTTDYNLQYLNSTNRTISNETICSINGVNNNNDKNYNSNHNVNQPVVNNDCNKTDISYFNNTYNSSDHHNCRNHWHDYNEYHHNNIHNRCVHNENDVSGYSQNYDTFYDNQNALINNINNNNVVPSFKRRKLNDHCNIALYYANNNVLNWCSCNCHNNNNDYNYNTNKNIDPSVASVYNAGNLNHITHNNDDNNNCNLNHNPINNINTNNNVHYHHNNNYDHFSLNNNKRNNNNNNIHSCHHHDNNISAKSTFN